MLFIALKFTHRSLFTKFSAQLSLHFQRIRSMSTAYPKSYGNFDLLIGPIKDSTSEAEVALWRSRKSGLKVALVKDEGPVVEGYFTVATEIFDDSGRPHTLEHLIFLGSEKYPYKGVLDTLANRSFARGTNAWTDTTHTCYTLSTAGQEGFLKLLPVYMDHLFYPTLTDAGFTTEVFHINGEGKEAGVVFSEMQGRENSSYDLMALQTQRLLYSEGSGYRSETGGLMENLRVLNCQQIRDYHTQMYVPHNTCVLVIGSVIPQDLLDTLQNTVEVSAEKHNQTHGPTGPVGWKRPWLQTPSSADPSRTLTEKISVVDFPDEEDEEEGIGEVTLTWLGPPSTEFLTIKALDVMTDYLAESSISPFRKEFVEVEEPLCSYLHFSIDDAEINTIGLNLSSVPESFFDSVTTRVKKLFRSIQSGGIDMIRMKAVLNRSRARVLDVGETFLASSFADTIIADFLYGQREGGDLPQILNDRQMYEELEQWNQEQWQYLLKKYFISSDFVAVLAKPSEQLSKELKSSSERRIKETKLKYGKEGLKKLDESLKLAQRENERKLPPEILTSFKVPDIKSVQWYDVQTARSGGVAKSWKDQATLDPHIQQIIDDDGPPIPYFVQFQHIKSNFAKITVHMYPSSVPQHLLALLAIWNFAFYHLPIIRSDGTQLSYEDVVAGLDEDTVEYSAYASGDALEELMVVQLKVEVQNYKKGVQWLRDLLWKTQFHLELIKIEVIKHKQLLSSWKREGSEMASYLMDDLVLDSKRSIKASMGVFALMRYLPQFLERLEQDPEQLKNDFEELRKIFTDPANMRISVTGDMERIQAPSSTFLTFGGVKATPNKQPHLAQTVTNNIGKTPSRTAVILAMNSVESSWAYHACQGPTNWEHEDGAALVVLLAIFNDMENFFWRHVRGEGLAYGCYLSVNVDFGLIFLVIESSPLCSKAFLAVRDLVDKVVRAEVEIDDITIETVKSSLVYSTAEAENTRPEAAKSAFVNQALKGISATYKRDRLSLIANITKDDILRVLRKWILPLFKPDTSVAAVAASTGICGDIEKAFKDFGYDVENRTLTLPGSDDSSVEEDDSWEDVDSQEEDNS